ncbi:MAG: hypothetical protein JO199_09500 [Candidatus Eremiobacteraeota bacterium]|nr:hypothetical protein [Candidatus Eremiobacteraeota bacterium]
MILKSSFRTIPGNLPSRPNPYVGHSDELMRIIAALDDNEIVTITGPGGVGKTRTAIELATRVAGFFPDGVWYVNLALLDDGTDVVPFVCETLRDIAPLARDAASFASAIGGRRALLLFDSCEHVLTQTAALVAKVTEVSPGARILLTSRQPLGLPNEVPHRLESLPLEDAIELFFERASAAGAPLEQDRRDVVGAIVSYLDAIPLAIELAAPLLRSMSAEDLLRHLDDRLQLLSMENRGAPTRQQTLEAVHDWSHRLLSENAQKLFRRLAIFVGGSTLEATMLVCADTEFNEARLGEALDELVSKSLVIAEMTGEFKRYRMLESTRAYAQARLFESGEYDDAAQAHVQYFVMLARRYEAMLDAVTVQRWQSAVSLDAQNFRAALSLSLDAGDVESPAAICEALHQWLWVQGPVHATDLTRRIAIILATTMDPASEAALRLGYASLLRPTDRQRSLESAKRSYDLYRELGDKYHCSDALRATSGLQMDVFGAPSVKLSTELERYADLMLEAGNTLRAAELLNNLGVAYAQTLEGDHLSDALVCFERAAGLLAARGDRERAGRVIGNSSVTAYILGDVELAVRWSRRAVDFFENDPDIMEAGHQWANYGFLLSLTARYDEAQAALRRAIEIARNRSDRDGLGEALENAAHYHHFLGNHGVAALLIGCAAAVRLPDVARQAHEAGVHAELVEALREQLGSDAYEAEVSRGKRSTVDEVVREAALA